MNIERKKMRKPIHKNKEISTCITVTSKECRGDNEKMGRKFLKKVKSIPVVKSTPTQQNYNSGYYYRYFSRRINGTSYLEIDKITYRCRLISVICKK